jgi:hypothetical protein
MIEDEHLMVIDEKQITDYVDEDVDTRLMALNYDECTNITRDVLLEDIFGKDL